MLAQAFASIALGLLAASGLAKLIDSEPTTGAMKSARLPASRAITYALAAIEITVAVMGLTTDVVVGAAGAAALLYAAFTLFTFAAVRKRIPVQSCGCFGREDTPPSWIHVAFNATATVALASTALLRLPPVDWSLPIGQLVLYGGFTVMGVCASYLLLNHLPRLLELARS